MKRFLTIIALAAAMLFTSCHKDDSVKFVNGILTLKTDSAQEGPVPESYKVVFTNVGTGESFTFETTGSTLEVNDASGIVPGIYNIVVSASVSAGGMAYNYVGALENVEYKSGIKDLGTITLAGTKASALVFKEIHYNASKTLDGKSYLKDTFLEIYNNSEQTVFLDGICLGDALSHSKFDFSSKSDKLGTKNASDYIFIGTFVWRIPGSGKEYPLAPGESVIIAASAMDHTTVANTVDLSGAEFEAICDKYKEKGITDEPAINLDLACTIKSSGLGNQMGMFVQGAWVLFYPSEGLRNDGEYLESDNAANNFGQEVLKKDILDAVETLNKDTAEKRLETSIDAGFVVCKPTGNNQSIVRKKAGVNALGFTTYQDTNNTTEDFDINDTPEVRRDGAKVPSWNTWKK